MKVVVFFLFGLLGVRGWSVNLERVHRHLHKEQVDANAQPASLFPVPLDHFGLSPLTFNLRFWENSTFDSEYGPIFVYIGGEGALNANAVNRGFANSLAQIHKGRVVALEHRFYGESQPFQGSLKDDELNSGLSSQQALFDLALFVEYYRGQKGVKGRPFVAIGGSYPGALSAWARLKFPQLFVASLASSAPVEAKADFFEYDQAVGAAMDERCLAGVVAATAAVEKRLKVDPVGTIRGFGCAGTLASNATASDFEQVSFLYVLADTVAYAVQYGGREAMCKHFSEGAGVDPVDLYASFVNKTFHETGLFCPAWDLATAASNVTSGSDPESNMRQWMWQSCAAFGYFQCAPSEGVSVRSTRITLGYHLELCGRLFPTYAAQFASGEFPRVNATNAYYGGKTAFAGTSVFFSNGGVDPWHKLSATKPSDFVNLGLIGCAVIVNGSHCTDLGTPNNATDSASLKAVREQIERALATWINADGVLCGGDAPRPSAKPSAPPAPPGKPSKGLSWGGVLGVSFALIAVLFTASFVLTKRYQGMAGKEGLLEGAKA